MGPPGVGVDAPQNARQQTGRQRHRNEQPEGGADRQVDHAVVEVRIGPTNCLEGSRVFTLFLNGPRRSVKKPMSLRCKGRGMPSRRPS